MIKHRGRCPSDLRRLGHQVWILAHKGRRIYPVDPVEELPPLIVRTVEDSDGLWGEWGFRTEFVLTGNAAAGWTDPSGRWSFVLLASADLQTWRLAQFTDCPGNPTTAEDGSNEYWSRFIVPLYWSETMIDFTLSTDRYGKSITGISVLRTAVGLTGFPYVMPADKTRLQTDLRSAGFTGATVSSTTAALSVEVKNYTPGVTWPLDVTMSGSNVTAVAFGGTTISLPAYPYAMPGQRAALQTALRAAGQSGAVVTLYGDPWEINLPNVLAGGTGREFVVTITPDDPWPAWNVMSGAYLGEMGAAGVVGSWSNVRTPAGDPLEEAPLQFASLKITGP